MLAMQLAAAGLLAGGAGGRRSTAISPAEKSNPNVELGAKRHRFSRNRYMPGVGRTPHQAFTHQDERWRGHSYS
jgi:hypothetical protein